MWEWSLSRYGTSGEKGSFFGGCYQYDSSYALNSSGAMAGDIKSCPSVGFRVCIY